MCETLRNQNTFKQPPCNTPAQTDTYTKCCTTTSANNTLNYWRHSNVNVSNRRDHGTCNRTTRRCCYSSSRQHSNPSSSSRNRRNLCAYFAYTTYASTPRTAAAASVKAAASPTSPPALAHRVVMASAPQMQQQTK